MSLYFQCNYNDHIFNAHANPTIQEDKIVFSEIMEFIMTLTWLDQGVHETLVFDVLHINYFHMLICILLL